MFGYSPYGNPAPTFVSDMEKIFPEMASGVLWTTTLSPGEDNDYAWAFNIGSSNQDDNEDHVQSHSLSEKHRILCVSRDHASFTTSSGAQFNLVVRPGFAPAWQAPGGTVWSNHLLGAYSGDDAGTACEKMGATLPSYLDFENLASDFERDAKLAFTPQGSSDYLALSGRLPNYSPNYLWSSSGPVFITTTGQLVTYYDLTQASARCVSE